MHESTGAIAVSSASRPEWVNHSAYFSIGRLLKICRRYWLSIFLVFLALFVPMALVAFNQPVLYTAEVKILLENTRRINLEMSTALSARETERVLPVEKINSQAEILKSATLLRDLIRELGLAQTPAEEQAKLSQLQRDIKVRVIPTSSVISISYSDPDPDLARKVVNTLGAIYQQYYLRLVEGENPVSLYQTQYEYTDNTLKQDMAEIQALRAKLGIAGDYQTEHKNLMDKLTSLRTQQTEADLALGKLEVKASLLNQQLAQEPATVNSSTETIPNPQAQGLSEELSRLTAERDALRTRYTTQHHEVKRKEQEIAALQARLAQIPRYIKGKSSDIINPNHQKLRSDLDQAQIEIRQWRNTRRQLEQDSAAVENQLSVMDRNAYRFTSLEDAIAGNIKARNMYHSKLVDARLLDTMNRENILSAAVIENAIFSSSSSNPTKTIAMSFALSLLLAVGTAVLRDWRQPRLHSADELGARLHLPVLATIPDFSKEERLRLGHANGKASDTST